MQSKKLTNFKINAYFCWQNAVKEGWENLKRSDLTEIEIIWEAR